MPVDLSLRINNDSIEFRMVTIFLIKWSCGHFACDDIPSGDQLQNMQSYNNWSNFGYDH